MKRRQRAAMAALLLAVALVPGNGRAETTRLPLLAVDPLTDVADLECRTEALPRWLSRGFTGATLLLVDSSPGIRPLGEARSAELAEIRRSYAGGSPIPAGLENAARHCSLEAGFVRAAVDLGIVREVFWIMPYDSFRSTDPGESLRDELRLSGLVEEDIGTFALREGCFRGTAGGVPLAVCGVDALPSLAGPVLVGIDAQFVLAAVAAARTNPVAEIRRLLEALATRKYAVADAALSASVSAGRVPPNLHWIGETIAQALQDPGLLARTERDRRWDKLQEVAVLLGRGEYTEMLHRVWPLLTLHEEDPALHLFAAEAHLGRGKMDDALGSAEEACRLNRGYCYALPAIGLRLFTAQDLDGGERFFASGARLRPGMTYGQFDRGLVLLAAGRQAQSLAVFQALSDGGEAFPAGFLAGAISLESDDRQSAARHFDQALAALAFLPDAAADYPDTFWAVGEAVRFYREEGLAAKAKLLESNPRLVPPSVDPPQSP